MGKLAVYKSGDKYGMITLTGKSYSVSPLGTMVEVICECGKTDWGRLTVIKAGKKRSCGCLAKESLDKGRLSHGLSNHSLYTAWSDMVQRCSNPKNESFHSYGGRGITICKEWRDDAGAFIEWALKNGWQRNSSLTLERKDNDRGYSPENCKYANKHEQSRNRRNNVFLTLFGETKCVVDWSNDIRCNVAYNTITYRINKLGWGVGKAILTPPLR
jgi:hypothetical protein